MSDVTQSDAPVAEPAAIAVTPEGPLVIRGNIHMQRADGRVATVARIALCRCGASRRKPMCDGSHRTSGFLDAGAVALPVPKAGDPMGDAARLLVTTRPDGPLWLEGAMQVMDASGAVCWQGSAAALCRCGASARKPFCDGAHKAAGFRSDADSG